MGTRTYSRRSVTGERRPTGLGIRTGKWKGTIPPNFRGQVPPEILAQRLSEYAARNALTTGTPPAFGVGTPPTFGAGAPTIPNPFRDDFSGEISTLPFTGANTEGIIPVRNTEEFPRPATISVNQAYNGWNPNFRSASPEEFIKAKNASTRGAYLSELSPEDIANHTIILSQDGKVGALVSPEGDIQNVFNNGGPSGAGVEAIIAAIRAGGRTLDAFDGYLPQLYTQFGFVETGRVRFDPNYAPDGWNYERDGQPDVVFMRLQPTGESEDQIRGRALDRPRPSDDYDGSWVPRTPSNRYYDDWYEAKVASQQEG